MGLRRNRCKTNIFNTKEIEKNSKSREALNDERIPARPRGNISVFVRVKLVCALANCECFPPIFPDTVLLQFKAPHSWLKSEVIIFQQNLWTSTRSSKIKAFTSEVVRVSLDHTYAFIPSDAQMSRVEADAVSGPLINGGG